MAYEGQGGEHNPQRSKAGVLVSVWTSMGAMNLKGEPGQSEKAWKLWQDGFEQATHSMAVSVEDKLNLFLLLGGEELVRLVETLPEQPASYVLHIEKLDQQFEAHWNNPLELYKFYNLEWPIDLPIADFETKCSCTVSFRSHWTMFSSC